MHADTSSRSHNCHDNHTYSAAMRGDIMLHQRRSQTGCYLFLQIWSLASKKNGVREREREEWKEERTDCGVRERETSSSHSSKFVPPGCLPVRRRPPARPRTEELAPAERTKPRHSRRCDGGAARPPSVRPSAGPVVSIWPISNMVRKQARPMSSDRMRR